MAGCVSPLTLALPSCLPPSLALPSCSPSLLTPSEAVLLWHSREHFCDSTRLDSTRLDSTRLDSTRLDSTRLDSARLGSTRLGLAWFARRHGADGAELVGAEPLLDLYELQSYRDGSSQSSPSTPTPSEARTSRSTPTPSEARTSRAATHAANGVRADGDGGLQLYRGAWRSGSRNGFGRLLVPQQGTCYAGEWSAGCFDGEGRWHRFASTGAGHLGVHMPRPAERYEGSWLRGVRSGFGKEQVESGETYDGEWKLGARSGVGRLQRADGSILMGEFESGLAHGEGTEVAADGTQQQGRWVAGRFADQHV